VGSDPRLRERSWAALVEGYWKPAYKHVRVKWRLGSEDARDALQEFFQRAVEKDFFASYDVERGRFRAFLRTCLDRQVSNALKAQQRDKRGGGVAPLSLDFDGAERELERAGAAVWETPEECFDREWRRHLFDLAVEGLRAECQANGKAGWFQLFERYDLTEGSRLTYAELGAELGVPATTVTNQLAWARRRFREQLLDRLGALTGNDDELREEARQLLG
jgi:RNA polymerase sigma factor (sigma-70 family)